LFQYKTARLPTVVRHLRVPRFYRARQQRQEVLRKASASPCSDGGHGIAAEYKDYLTLSL